MRQLLVSLGMLGLMACGGGSASTPPPVPPDPWAATTAAIQSAQAQFPGGLTVEVLGPEGAIYSRSFGGFTNQETVSVASASKWVTSTVLLRLVATGAFPHGLETQTQELLVDRVGQPWRGNMGAITLRHLLSFTSGISGDHPGSENLFITLDEAVLQIYGDLGSTASVPGSFFHYGSTHMRIAARMAERATQKSWAQLFVEAFRDPLGWSTQSLFSGGSTNPNPAGGLKCTGLDYSRFMLMQLRKGRQGTQAFLPESLITAQRTDGYGPGTTLVYSPYQVQSGRTYHYALGNWLETASGGAPSPTDPVIRYSSTGTFGWAPWIAADGAYAATIMTLQSQGNTLPSENLKAQLDPLIRAALTQGPPVVRPMP